MIERAAEAQVESQDLRHVLRGLLLPSVSSARTPDDSPDADRSVSESQQAADKRFGASDIATLPRGGFNDVFKAQARSHLEQQRKQRTHWGESGQGPRPMDYRR